MTMPLTKRGRQVQSTQTVSSRTTTPINFSHFTRTSTSLLTAIEMEGQQSGQSGPPKVVITNYPNPLPNDLPQKDAGSWASDFCPDTFPLYNAQIDYFSGLIDQLNSDLAGWVSAYQKTSEFGDNVSFRQLVQCGPGVSVVRRRIWEPQPKHT